MDSPGYVRPAGNGLKGETGTAVKYLKTLRAFKKSSKGFDTTSIGRGSAPHGGGCSYLIDFLIFQENVQSDHNGKNKRDYEE